MKERISFYTLGCRLNQAETAIMQKSMEQAGFRTVDFGDASDIVVINTCTVTENSDADTRRVVNKIQRINDKAKIALVGCQAQVQGQKLADLPGVKWVIGNALKMDLATLLSADYDGETQVLTPVIKKGSFTIPFAAVDENRTRANLKIQDGCDFFCSFCEIPFARGRARSREFEDILREARQLAAAGHQEVVLTGINVGTFSYEDKTICDVIASLEKISDLKRIRISSIEPTTIPGQLLDKIAERQKLCRYLHIPVQSGNDEILQNMNRKYSVAEFSDFIQKAHAKIENVCIGTDVIVGFPGETDTHFTDSYDTLRELPFTYFHVFSYSDRDHNKSRKYGNKVDKQTIDMRSKRMRDLSARKRRVYFERNIGGIESVLFEQKKNSYWTGLTDTYIRVKAKSELDIANQILPVRLEAVDQQTIIGTIL